MESDIMPRPALNRPSAPLSLKDMDHTFFDRLLLISIYLRGGESQQTGPVVSFYVTRCRLLPCVLRDVNKRVKVNMVGAVGFEPTTSASRTQRANRAALRPDRSSHYSLKCLFWKGLLSELSGFDPRSP